MRRVEVGRPFTVLVFLVLNTDGETAAEGLVNADFTSKQFIKSDGTVATISSTITAAADHGWYVVPFTAAEANVVGDLAIHLEAAGVVTLDVKVAEITPRSAIRRV